MDKIINRFGNRYASDKKRVIDLRYNIEIGIEETEELAQEQARHFNRIHNLDIYYELLTSDFEMCYSKEAELQLLKEYKIEYDRHKINFKNLSLIN